MTGHALTRLASRCVVLCLVAVIASCATTGSEPDKDLGMTGSWLLDDAANDDAADLMAAANRKRGGLLSGLRGGVRVYGIPLGAGADLGSGASAPGEARAMIDLLSADRLVVNRTGDAMVLHHDGVRVIYPIGESHEQGDRVTRSDWRGQTLRTSDAVEDGPKLVREFELRDGGQTMNVASKIGRTRITQWYVRSASADVVTGLAASDSE